MAQRAAIVTGASSGIGLAIARVLGEEGYALTLTARRPEKLSDAVAGLREEGYDILEVAGNMASEEDIVRVVTEHRERFGRLDVLVNNAGVGAAAPVAELSTKKIDMQIDVNLRAIVLFYRECAGLLREAGAEHRSALVVNTASISGKKPQPWMAVYSATKAAVIGYTFAMNRELNGDGVKSIALCPAFVDTPMTDWIKGDVKPEEMIQPEDVSEAVRWVLKLSPACVVPEIVFERLGEGL